jgi:hypothetical protein
VRQPLERSASFTLGPAEYVQTHKKLPRHSNGGTLKAQGFAKDSHVQGTLITEYLPSTFIG